MISQNPEGDKPSKSIFMVFESACNLFCIEFFFDVFFTLLNLPGKQTVIYAFMNIISYDIFFDCLSIHPDQLKEQEGALS